MSLQESIKQLYDLASQKEQEATKKASLYKIISNIEIFIITILSIFISSIVKSSFTWKDDVILSLGIIIFIIKSLSGMINFQHLAMIYEQISIKLRRLLLTIMQSENSDTIIKDLDNLYQQFNDLDINMFSTDLLGSSINNKNIQGYLNPHINNI